MDASRQAQHLVVTGGGTAGHVHPGLALARELNSRGWTVSWIGRPDSLEQRLVTHAGIDFDPVPALPVVGTGLGGRIRAVWTLVRAVPAARRELGRRAPRVVVGTGGYVSVPGVLAAWTRRCPILLFEPNAEMGSGNRLLARVADSIAWGHGEHDEEHHAVTGVPVDVAFEPAPPAEPEENDDVLRILVLGGSQGSEELNRLLPRALDRLGTTAGCRFQIVHQAGPAHEQTTRERYQQVEADAQVSVVGFIEDVASHMAQAQLIISRAGAQTLAELAAVGRPAILVPLGVARGHQAANARQMVAAGAAWTLEAAADESLAELLSELWAEPERLEEVAVKMAARATPDAARRLADQVERLVEAA